MISPMPSVAEAEPRTVFRPVIFTTSGRPDYLASACMSFQEWLRLDYEGGLSEWVDGEARLYMSVTIEHQAVVDFLNRLLGLFVEIKRLGVVHSAPYAMQSPTGGRGREPDLMFIAAANLHRIQSSHLHGPPDLAIEVVSEDSATRDYAEKLAEYAAAGVREYWVIDSRPGQARATFYVLEGTAFRAIEPVGDGVYPSAVVEGFWLRVSWLWASPQPTAEALGELLGTTLA